MKLMSHTFMRNIPVGFMKNPPLRFIGHKRPAQPGRGSAAVFFGSNIPATTNGESMLTMLNLRRKTDTKSLVDRRCRRGLEKKNSSV
jgi:hypothetical protein